MRGIDWYDRWKLSLEMMDGISLGMSNGILLGTSDGIRLEKLG